MISVLKSLVTFKGKWRQEQKRIREMCCLCTRTNLDRWVGIVYCYTVINIRVSFTPPVQKSWIKRVTVNKTIFTV